MGTFLTTVPSYRVSSGAARSPGLLDVDQMGTLYCKGSVCLMGVPFCRHFRLVFARSNLSFRYVKRPTTKGIDRVMCWISTEQMEVFSAVIGTISNVTTTITMHPRPLLPPAVQVARLVVRLPQLFSLTPEGNVEKSVRCGQVHERLRLYYCVRRATGRLGARNEARKLSPSLFLLSCVVCPLSPPHRMLTEYLRAALELLQATVAANLTGQLYSW